jgi:hypothetical protein
MKLKEQNPQETPVTIVCDPAEIRTMNLLITRLGRCRYTNLLGKINLRRRIFEEARRVKLIHCTLFKDAFSNSD